VLASRRPFLSIHPYFNPSVNLFNRPSVQQSNDHATVATGDKFSNTKLSYRKERTEQTFFAVAPLDISELVPGGDSVVVV
jgi:hypothetical protein